MANGETGVFRPFAKDPVGLERLIEAVIAEAPSQLILPALPADDPALAALTRASSSGGRWAAVERQYTSLIADTRGDLAEYRRRIKPDGWAAVERRRRKLEREHRPTFHCLEPAIDLEAQLEQYLAIEASGWKGQNGTAIVCSPDMDRFYRSIAGAFHAAGSLRLSELALEERPVAFELQLLHAGRVFALKRGYHEAYRRLGPGMVLQVAVIVRCCELGLEAYEFLGESEPYKRRFATSERQHRRLRSYRRGPVPGARFVYRRSVRPVLRKAYRRGLKRLGRGGQR